MLSFAVVAIVTVIGILIMMNRIGLRKFLGYANTVDLLMTIVFLVMFAGTFSGMVVAGIASLLMSVMLGILRSMVGAERLSIRRVGFIRFQIYWKFIPASECRPHWLANMFKPAAVQA